MPYIQGSPIFWFKFWRKQKCVWEFRPGSYPRAVPELRMSYIQGNNLLARILEET